MPTRTLRRFVPLLIVAAVVGPTGGLGAPAGQSATPAAPPAAAGASAPMQPSYDVLRVQQAGGVVPYRIWWEWVPLLVTTPDGGAWAFFSADTTAAADGGTRRGRLFAARFDPQAGAWLAAAPMPGGEIQFGPAAAVDRAGTVHLVYSDRAAATPEAFATLVYTHTDGAGSWTPPVPVAPEPNAGHQMTPALGIDGADRLHVVWRDQRAVAPEARAAQPANADVFASDLVDGAWSAAVPVDPRPSPDLHAGWPQLAVDGERLVAVWSVYQADDLLSPVRVEWNTRPLGDPAEWSAPTTLLERDGGDTGGRAIDLASDPRGGLVLVHGRTAGTTTDLFLRRLAPAAAEWGAERPLGSGDFGYLPTLGVGPTGTAYVAYNDGHDQEVEVGALAIPPDDRAPLPPPQVLTPGEDGQHARPSAAVDADGRLWVLYVHAAVGGTDATEIRSLRGAQLGL